MAQEPDLDAIVATMPFAVASGVELTHATADQVRGRIAWSEERCTIGGAMHGGALMVLCDSLGAVCAFLNLPDGAAGTSTIESKTNFFRAVRSGYASVETTVLHAGRTTIVVQSDVRDDEGRRVALVTQTQAVIFPR